MSFTCSATLLLAALACAASSPPTVPAGDWGGQGAALTVEEAQATLQLDCAHGRLEGEVPLDAQGRFQKEGRYVRERGGPTRRDDDTAGVPALFSGTVRDSKMSLVVKPQDGEALGPFTLTLGGRARLHRCR